MAIPTLIVAGLLIVLGGAAYGYAAANATPDDPASPTALIPAFFGVLLLLCGLVALKESLRKHAMHLAVLIALLGLVGALMRPVSKFAAGDPPPVGVPLISQGVMALICLAFVILCVRSFVQARRARSG